MPENVISQNSMRRADAAALAPPRVLTERPRPGRLARTDARTIERLVSFQMDAMGFDPAESKGVAGELVKVMARTQSLFDGDALRRADAFTDTAFFQRQLLYIDPTTYSVKYPDARWREIVPIKTDVPSGAESFATHIFDDIGDSGNTASGAGAEADGDDYSDSASMVEVQGSEDIGKIRAIIKAYSYSIQDLRRAAFANVPLDAMKAQRVRRIMERRMDYLACVGDSRYPVGDSRKTGLANDPNISSVTKGTQASGTQWDTATADEMLADVTALMQKVFNVTDGTHTPNALFVGSHAYAILSTKRLDEFNQTTVGEYLLRALPWLQRIEHWPRLNTAGASNKERILALELNRENFELVVPQDFEQFPPQMRGLLFMIFCHMRCGGYAMRYPKSVAYMDGTGP